MPTFRPHAEQNIFTEDDWLEALGAGAAGAPGGGDTFSNESGEAVLTAIIRDPRKLRSAYTYIMGYSYADESSPYKLHRVPPVAHPIWGEQLRAASVHFTRYQPLGNPENENNAPWELSDIVSEGLAYHARYGAALATVRFAPAPYYLYDDDHPEWSRNEYDRYCTRYQVEPSLEILSADAGSALKWVDGPAPPKGEQVPASLGDYLGKTLFNLVWHQVPAGYVEDDKGKPAKILNCVGRVNNADFLGFTAGTLLLLPPKLDKFLFPFFSDDGRAYHYKITLPFQEFDPTLGPSQTLNVHGHNLMPWRGGGTNGGPAWYLATRDGTTNGPRFLESADFGTIFQHARQP